MSEKNPKKCPYQDIGGQAVMEGVMMQSPANESIAIAVRRPSARGNAAYSALTALGVTVVLLGRRMNWPLALCAGAAAFVLCFALLTALMAYVRRRQREQADTFEDE